MGRNTRRRGWGLIIFLDEDLEKGLFKKTKTIYTPTPSNRRVNKRIKGNFINNEELIQSLYTLYYKYISRIRTKPDIYDFVKLYSYKDDRVKSTRGYLGLPSTYGSFIRFIPLFQDFLPKTLRDEESPNFKKTFFLEKRIWRN